VTVAAVAAHLRDLALEAGAENLAADAAALGERVREGRFYVACVGQFKRGKSTLLNALVGQPVLPVGVVPVTAVPTVLRYGAAGVRVRTRLGWVFSPVEEVAEYVTEQRNSGNEKGVLAVEVLLPAEILSGGLCLVDTPGLGSVFEVNSETTRDFVPHIDAAIVVLGADPPITGEELRLVEVIGPQVETLLFVLNKIDRVSVLELEEAIVFLRTVLRRRLDLAAERVFRVSAAGGGAGPDWPSLREELRALAVSRREALVHGALRRGAARIGGALAAHLQERLAALNRPVAESERRIAELAELGASFDRALFELAPLLAAEAHQLEQELWSGADDFAAHAGANGLRHLRAVWAEPESRDWSRMARLEEANRIARTVLHPWRRRTEEAAESAYQAIVQRFTRLANEQLTRLGEQVGESMPGLANTPDGFTTRPHFAFSDRLRYHYPRSPLPAVMRRLLPTGLRRQSDERAAERYLLDLLRVNASRVVGDIADRVQESRRGVEAEIRENLRAMSVVAGRALDWAREVRAGGGDETVRETARLKSLLDRVERLLEPIHDQAA
jgi:GTP-binding protein EngB required for normal cell division